MSKSIKTLFILLLFSFLSLSAVAEETTTYKIEHMKENVYRFTFGHYHSVFMVTEKGLFLTDPISDKAASYLRRRHASAIWAA